MLLRNYPCGSFASRCFTSSRCVISISIDLFSARERYPLCQVGAVGLGDRHIKTLVRLRLVLALAPVVLYCETRLSGTDPVL